DVMRHRRRARREDGDVASAFALQLQLRALETRANLVVGHLHRAFGAGRRRILQLRELRVSKVLESFWSRRVVPMAVDDHAFIARSILSSSAIVGTTLAALDSGSRFSRIALTNSTSWRSNAGTLSSGTSLPSLSVIESR